MSTAQKLTKKQKKGIAFRDRKSGKGKPKRPDDENYALDVPIVEDQDMAGVQDSVVEDTQEGAAAATSVVANRKDKGKGKEKSADVVADAAPTVVVGAKKRKREAAEAKGGADGKQGETEKPKAKKRKGSAGEAIDLLDEVNGAGSEAAKGQAKQRFILFLGNLKYTTTLEAIQAHFAACDPPPTVRLLTPKPSTSKPLSKPITKSKGCAFLEFKHRNALQQGLKLHHSQLDGRQVNVELTAGGGGKSEARIGKVKERNKELEAQRRKRSEKLEKQPNREQPAPRVEGAQRYSATSGAEQVVTKNRTWTVGDVEETETHRGGKKHAKRGKGRRPSAREWGTGVNAIPVG
ncbi:hypothetical protein BV22DRAFT_54083 [Leucogyrophana mollusca]|uniref:Uncharacterized protein n=1 Tax=Leucogyrophana mollusca TaxID=85980 RepID=A0ACB8BZH8_9AGAM|nr:hypothetical protein BV22DRAFT_54083 [Leucogyrophana mollusca]